MPDRPVTRVEFQLSMDGLTGRVRKLEDTVEGPPHPGLERRVNTFIDRFEAVETTRHEENQQKLGAIEQKMGQRSLWVAVGGLAVAIASVLVGIAAIAATIYLAKHADLEPLRLFGAKAHSALSSLQESRIPPLGR